MVLWIIWVGLVTEAFLLPLRSPVVDLDLEACPTCLFADLHDVPLDYYGRPLDVKRLLDNTPTPTLPLKISFAAPRPVAPQATSSPPNPPELARPLPDEPAPSALPIPVVSPAGDTYLETILIWIGFFLGWFCFSWQSITFYYTDTAQNVVAMRLWDILSLFACRLASAAFSEILIASTGYLTRTWNIQRAKFALSKAKAQLATGTQAVQKVLIDALTAVLPIFNRLQRNWTIQRVNLASSKANAQLATRTNAVENALTKSLVRVVLTHYEEPATMMLVMHSILVAQYGDACTQNIMSEQGEARQSKVAKGASDAQANIKERKKKVEAPRPEATHDDRKDLAGFGQQENEGRDPQSKRADWLGDETGGIVEGTDDREVQPEITDEGPEGLVELVQEDAENLDGTLEDTFRLEDESEESLDRSPSRDVKNLLDLERSRWTEEKSRYLAIIEDLTKGNDLLQFQVGDLEQQLSANRDYVETIDNEKDLRIQQLEKFSEMQADWIKDAQSQPRSLPIDRKADARPALPASEGRELKDPMTSDNKDSLSVPDGRQIDNLTDEELQNNPEWDAFLEYTKQNATAQKDAAPANEVESHGGDVENEDVVVHENSSNTTSVDDGSVQTQDDYSGGSPLSPPRAEPEPEGSAKTKKQNAEREKAEKAEEALKPQQNE